LGTSSNVQVLGWTLIFAAMVALQIMLNTDSRGLMLTLGFFRRDLRPVILYYWKGPTEHPHYSLAHLDPDTNTWQCPVYWSNNIGSCVLKPNGVVHGESSYIMYWRPLRKTELMMHLFTEVEHVWGQDALNKYRQP
jgi:hypothetical protein